MPGFVDANGNPIAFPVAAAPPPRPFDQAAVTPATAAAFSDAVLAAPPPDPVALDPDAPSGIPAAPLVPAPPPRLALVPPPPAPVPVAAPAPPVAGQPGARPSPAAGGEPLGELMAAATAPPDPGGDAVDQALAAGRAPAAVAAKPGDLTASATRAAGAEADQEAALKRQGEVEAANAAREAEVKQKAADEAARRQAIQEQARAESDRAIQAAREAAAKKPFHGFWEDKSVGQRILAMIGIMLGGVSWDKNNRNEAADIINQSIARDFEKQKEEHAQLWRNVDAAQQQGQSLRANQLQEMGSYRLNQALQLEAVIAKGNQLAAGAKNEVGIAALRANNAKLGYARDQAFEEARRLDAAARESARHNQAEEAIGRGHLAVARTNAATGKQGAEELKVAAALDRQLGRDKVTTGRLAALDKLNEAKAAIATGNPVAIQGAIDGYVRAQTGLGARPGSIKLFTDRLGGAYQQLQAWVEEKKSGALPPAMIKRFSSAVDAAAADNTGELKKSRALHEKALLASPEYKRHPEVVKAHLDDRFSAVLGDGAGAEADPMRAKAQKALDDPRAPPAAKDAAKRYLGLAP